MRDTRKKERTKTKNGRGKGETFSERSVSQKTMSHWKPISKASQALQVQTVDTAIVSVLSQTSSVAYSDVQEVLNSLKRRILEKSQQLKAPVTKRPKTGTLEAACHKLERDTVEAIKFEDHLSDKVEELRSIVEEKEKLLEDLEKKLGDPETTENQNGADDPYEDRLGIPLIRKTRSQSKRLARQNVLPNPGVDNILSSLSEKEGLTSIKDYITNLADFVTLLPKE